jgi:hypothetical protein
MNRPANEITSLSANTQAMGLPQFLAQANPMIASVDSAMTRMSGKPKSKEEIRAELERAEDNFLARKEMEARRNETFLDAGM